MTLPPRVIGPEGPAWVTDRSAWAGGGGGTGGAAGGGWVGGSGADRGVRGGGIVGGVGVGQAAGDGGRVVQRPGGGRADDDGDAGGPARGYVGEVEGQHAVLRRDAAGGRDEGGARGERIGER